MKRAVTFVLALLVGWVQFELWFGKGSVPHVMSLRSEVATAKERNDASQSRNERLAAEVRDLEEGLEMVEEQARWDLGMVKPNEIYVHVDPRAVGDAPLALPPSSQSSQTTQVR